MGITIIVRKGRRKTATVLDACRKWEEDGQKFTPGQVAFWKTQAARLEHEQGLIAKGKSHTGEDLKKAVADDEMVLQPDGTVENADGYKQPGKGWKEIGDLPDQCVGIKEVEK